MELLKQMKNIKISEINVEYYGWSRKLQGTGILVHQQNTNLGVKLRPKRGWATSRDCQLPLGKSMRCQIITDGQEVQKILPKRLN